MKCGKIVYRKVLARMALMDMNKREVARRIGMCYSSFQNKLCGTSDFTLQQAMAIKRLLNFDETLEEIFVRCDEPETQEALRDAISG